MSGNIFHVESNDGEIVILTQADDRYIYERAGMNISRARFLALFHEGGDVYDASEFDKAVDVGKPRPITSRPVTSNHVESTGS